MAKFVKEQIPIDPDAHISIIKTSASNNWYLQYNKPGRGKGRQRRESLKTASTKEAKARAARFANRFISGQFPHRPSRLATFGDVAAQRLERLHQNRTRKTARVYAGHYKALAAALPQGDKTPLVSLTTSLLEKVEKALREGGVSIPSTREGKPARKSKPRKPKGVREVMKACRGLIRFALARELIDRDPAAAYALPRGASDEIIIFSADELGKIFGDPRPGMSDTWRFMTHCALRIDEFCWLTKSDVITDEGGTPVSILIRKKVLRETQERWSPKAGHERVIPLTAEAKDIAKRQMNSDASQWLFQAPATSKSPVAKWTADRLRDQFTARLRACHITHGTPHVLRHTFASFLAKAMPLPVLQRFLGHNDVQTTMRYVHVDARDIAAALGTCDVSRLTHTLDGKNKLTNAMNASADDTIVPTNVHAKPQGQGKSSNDDPSATPPSAA